MSKPENAGASNLHERASATARQAIRPAYLAHIVLNSADVPAMHAWYEKVLGAESAYAVAGSHQADSSGQQFVVDLDFMTFDDEHHRIAFMHRKGVAVDRAINHIAFTYRNLRELVATWRRLAAVEIHPSFTIHHGPTISIYYHDPDGNRIELQVDVFPNIQALSDWFARGNFNPDPKGRTFDFTALAEEVERGAELDYLLSNEGFIDDYNRARGIPPQPPATGNGSTVARLPVFGNAIVRPRALSQIVLKSSDTGRLRAWYDTLVGPSENPADAPLAFVAAPDVGTRTLDHIAFTYATFGDLEATYRRLAAHSILPVASTRRTGIIANFYADPEGNPVMLGASLPESDQPDGPIDFQKLADHLPIP